MNIPNYLQPIVDKYVAKLGATPTNQHRDVIVSAVLDAASMVGTNIQRVITSGFVGVTTATPAPVKRKPAARPRPAAKAAPGLATSTSLDGRILATCSNPTLAHDIVRNVGGARKRTLARIPALVKAGQLRKDGHGRSTTYQLVPGAMSTHASN